MLRYLANRAAVLQAPLQQDSKVLWLMWGMVCLIVVAILSVTSLVILPVSIVGYSLFVVSVLCKGVGGAFSSFGLTILLFFNNKEGTISTPSWISMAQRVTTLIGLLGLLMVGRSVALISVALCFFFIYKRASLGTPLVHSKTVQSVDPNNKKVCWGWDVPLNGELLPQEIMVHILAYLDVPQLLEVSNVCHAWYKYTQSQQLWKYHCSQLTTSPMSNNEIFGPFTNWQLLYQQKCLCVATVSRHNSRDDAWIIIGHNVYDITKFMHQHPGGEDLLLQFAGKDATEAFEDIDHTETALKSRKGLEVGRLQWVPDTKRRSGSLSLIANTFKLQTNSPSCSDCFKGVCAASCKVLDAIKPSGSLGILVAFVALHLCEYLVNSVSLHI